jgi:hypothetical protein
MFDPHGIENLLPQVPDMFDRVLKARGIHIFDFEDALNDPKNHETVCEFLDKLFPPVPVPQEKDEVPSGS